MKRDVLRVYVSDFHSSSNFALFLNRKWQGRKTSVIYPNSKQEKIRRQFDVLCHTIKQARKDKAIELIHDGDAIDGDHHNSGDVCTTNELEQADIHIELMNEFIQRIGWQGGDRLWYVKGTPTHVRDMEEYIAEQLNAQPAEEFRLHDKLVLNTHGTESWFYHHGVARGNGMSEGDPMRNVLKRIYIEALKDKTSIPDIVVTGHVHDPTYSPYEYRRDWNFITMHGIILPSFQVKTEYAHMKVPISRNVIGGVYHTITARGEITKPQFVVGNV
jgi:hypothetical protein